MYTYPTIYHVTCLCSAMISSEVLVCLRFKDCAALPFNLTENLDPPSIAMNVINQ